VALLETIRGKAGRGPRRGQAKPPPPPPPVAGAAAAADKRVWAKLIARLSRKMGAARLASSRSSAGAQQVPDNAGTDLHPASSPSASASSHFQCVWHNEYRRITAVATS